MELIERDSFLSELKSAFDSVSKGEGHCVFISGEAGIGKTSLVKEFVRMVADDAIVYQGSCDALFTPRPMAPLYDVATQNRLEKMAGATVPNSLLPFSGSWTKIEEPLCWCSRTSTGPTKPHSIL